MASYKGYVETEQTSNIHFMIAEGDIVVMEFDSAQTTHDGDSHHNEHCLVIRVRDNKICEVREHADSHYSFEVCMGTPEKRAAVHDRLARLRAGQEP